MSARGRCVPAERCSAYPSWRQSTGCPVVRRAAGPPGPVGPEAAPAPRSRSRPLPDRTAEPPPGEHYRGPSPRAFVHRWAARDQTPDAAQDDARRGRPARAMRRSTHHRPCSGRPRAVGELPRPNPAPYAGPADPTPEPPPRCVAHPDAPSALASSAVHRSRHRRLSTHRAAGFAANPSRLPPTGVSPSPLCRRARPDAAQRPGQASQHGQLPPGDQTGGGWHCQRADPRLGLPTTRAPKRCPAVAVRRPPHLARRLRCFQSEEPQPTLSSP